jgi:hypothetical protein
MVTFWAMIEQHHTMPTARGALTAQPRGAICYLRCLRSQWYAGGKGISRRESAAGTVGKHYAVDRGLVPRDGPLYRDPTEHELPLRVTRYKST